MPTLEKSSTEAEVTDANGTNRTNGKTKITKVNGSGKGTRSMRRGWREKIEPGLYRNHRVGCRASYSRQPGVRCQCPFQAHLPTDVPGKTYPQNLQAKTLREAREEKARRQREGRRKPRKRNAATVADFFWDVFIVKHRLRPATKRNYERIFRTYHEPIVGSLGLSELNQEHVAELISHLEKAAERQRLKTQKRNSAWIAQQLIPLQSALSAAVRWRRLSENPLSHPPLPDCPPKQPGEIDTREDPKAILSKAQLELLYAAASDRHVGRLTGARDECLFRTVYEFALRNSEARGLRWTDVDFENHRLLVARQIDPVTGQESQTKGKRSRQPPGSAAAFERLAEWRRQAAAAGCDVETGYVWHGADPELPMPIALPNRRIKAAQKRAGLVDANGKPLIVFHGLRHSRASHLLLDGAPMLEVSRYLGHASQLVTASAYSHLVPEDEFAAIRSLFGD